MTRLLSLAATVSLALFAAFGPVRASRSPAPLQPLAAGFVNPRGITAGSDGSVYVAEAGRGGDAVVRAGDDKVEYHIGRTARLMRVDPRDGSVQPVLDSLPSVHWGDDTYGVAGVTHIGDVVYVLLGAGGRDVGDPAYHNLVLRLGAHGETQQVTDLTQFNLAAPPLARRLDPLRTDVEGGVPFGLVALGDHLYVTDGNQETVTEVGQDGSLRRVLEYPASNHVLTGIAAGPDGALYVAEFGPSPHDPGSGKVTRIAPDGTTSDAWTGLANVIAVAVDPAGGLYALEFSTGEREPNSGVLEHKASDGMVEVLATGLNFPTALAIGPGGTLYVTLNGHRSEDGAGQLALLTPATGGSSGLFGRVPYWDASRAVSPGPGLMGSVAAFDDGGQVR